MKRKIFFIVLCLSLFASSNIRASVVTLVVYSDSVNTSEDDSSVKSADSLYRCLVVRSYWFFKRSYIFRENKRLKVTTEDGRVMRGRLHLISDTSFSLINSINGKIDTFKISEVWKINNVSLFTSILTAGVEITGIAMTAFGVSLMKVGSSNNGLDVIGDMLTALGGGVLLSGLITINGKALKNYQYAFHLYSGLKPLKYRDLKRLYPR